MAVPPKRYIQENGYYKLYQQLFQDKFGNDLEWAAFIPNTPKDPPAYKNYEIGQYTICLSEANAKVGLDKYVYTFTPQSKEYLRTSFSPDGSTVTKKFVIGQGKHCIV